MKKVFTLFSLFLFLGLQGKCVDKRPCTQAYNGQCEKLGLKGKELKKCKCRLKHCGTWVEDWDKKIPPYRKLPAPAPR